MRGLTESTKEMFRDSRFLRKALMIACPVALQGMLNTVVNLVDNLMIGSLGSTAIADNIIVIDGGKVAEQGNHAHLMAQRGVYAQMYESQREWYIKDGAQGEADA